MVNFMWTNTLWKWKTSKDFGILIFAKNRELNRSSCHFWLIAHPIENYRCTTQDAPQSAKISDFYTYGNDVMSFVTTWNCNKYMHVTLSLKQKDPECTCNITFSRIVIFIKLLLGNNRFHIILKLSNNLQNCNFYLENKASW